MLVFRRGGVVGWMEGKKKKKRNHVLRFERKSKEVEPVNNDKLPHGQQEKHMRMREGTS